MLNLHLELLPPFTRLYGDGIFSRRSGERELSLRVAPDLLLLRTIEPDLGPVHWLPILVQYLPGNLLIHRLVLFLGRAAAGGGPAWVIALLGRSEQLGRGSRTPDENNPNTEKMRESETLIEW